MTAPVDIAWTELWRTRAGDHAHVEVSRHVVAMPDNPAAHDGTGPNRWCVYANIALNHPLHARFVSGGTIWQEPAMELPLHWGPTYFATRTHQRGEHQVVIHVVGADYNHVGDDAFTHMATREQAREVFDDAQRLAQFLAEYVAPVAGAEP